MKVLRVKAAKEPTIALINVVFLMLIFFLIAGAIAPQLDTDLDLVNTSDLDLTAPPEGLVLFPDGRLSSGGKILATVGDYIALLPVDQRQTVRLIPDQNLPAKILLETAAELRSAEVENVLIATQRAIE